MGFIRSSRGIAVLISCLFVFGALILIGRSKPDPVLAHPGPANGIGTVELIVGRADRRRPQTLDFALLAEGSPVFSGELIVAREASQVTLKFDGGASIRLQPGARVVSERDSSLQNAVLVTLLEGDADILATGAARSFRLFKNGRDLTNSKPGASLEPVLVSGGARTFTKTKTEPAVIVTASTPADTPTPAPPVGHMSDETGGTVSADSLSNDEIRRSLKSAGGFFQRCYLTYLNRVKNPPSNTTLVTVGFVISNSGKVRDAKIVRTDFNDAVLNNCILETVERTPFRAFKANDIPVLEFPIELR